MGLLGGPDVLLQPGHQGQVVGIAAQQAHAGVAVAVDQPRQQHLPGQFNDLARLMLAPPSRQQGGNTIARKRHAVVFQHLAMGNHRHDPVRVEQ